ncbi:MAG: hypothetical protein D6739_12545, partial [Nitrospirae bacterium]
MSSHHRPPRPWYLAALLACGLAACGGGGGGGHKPAPVTPAETAGVAGSWSGTWSEAAQVSTFTAAIDCAGGLTGTLTPSEGEAEEVSGTVTAWDPDTGAFQASLTRGGTTYTLTGVLNTND